MGLIGLVIASLINFFLRSAALDFAISLLYCFISLGSEEVMIKSDYGNRLHD
jgi:FtsH-binding integral membrane protein